MELLGSILSAADCLVYLAMYIVGLIFSKPLKQKLFAIGGAMVLIGVFLPMLVAAISPGSNGLVTFTVLTVTFTVVGWVLVLLSFIRTDRLAERYER